MENPNKIRPDESGWQGFDLPGEEELPLLVLGSRRLHLHRILVIAILQNQ